MWNTYSNFQLQSKFWSFECGKSCAWFAKFMAQRAWFPIRKKILSFPIDTCTWIRPCVDHSFHWLSQPHYGQRNKTLTSFCCVGKKGKKKEENEKKREEERGVLCLGRVGGGDLRPNSNYSCSYACSNAQTLVTRHGGRLAGMLSPQSTGLSNLLPVEESPNMK